MIRRVAVLIALFLSVPAHAGDKPLYQPAPAWVKAAPPIDAANLTDDSPAIVRLDQQQMLKDDQVWAYFDQATRMVSPQLLTQAGTLQLPWNPGKGDLIIHTLEIIRPGERVDLLAGKTPFTVLRREQQLEQLQINGLLTATTAVEGLRVGDVLHVAFSITMVDKTLGGNVQTVAPLLPKPAPIQFGRVRLLWPEDAKIQWRSYVPGVAPRVTRQGGFQELTVSLPIDELPEVPSDAPQRFRGLPLIEASSFGDWTAVSKVMGPLYSTEGTIARGSPLAQEVAKIAAASQDQRTRAALALRLVQDKVRYLLNGMGNGNYVPQAPAETWSLRYGDCKAKTMLLLAILHELGIEAEPVAASIELGDFVAGRLPAAAAFDHVIVHATIGGESLWLDGTSTGARLADLSDTPMFRTVLPLRTAGSGLLPLAMRPSTRPDVAGNLEVDQSAGILFPAPFKASIVFHGGTMEMLRLISSQAGKKKLNEAVAGVVGQFIETAAVNDAAIKIDDEAGTATVTASGIADPSWWQEDKRFKTTLDRAIGKIGFDPDRSRPAWSNIPVATGEPGHVVVHARIRLPDDGKGFSLEGDQALPATLAGNRLSRTVSLDGAWLTVEDRVIATGQEIQPAQIAATREAVATAKAHLLRAVAAADYPQRWQQIDAAKRAKKFEPLLAAYAASIAAAPDDIDRYLKRSEFLASIYDWQGAVRDLDEAISIAPTAALYLRRSGLLFEMGQSQKALADAVAARSLDPGASDPLLRIAYLKKESGDSAGALETIGDRASAGGKDKVSFQLLKAEVLADSGKMDDALATLDAALKSSPGNADLLNSRCWLKGTHGVALDTALKDCTKAIELAEYPAAALDSRAMVYFRMNRFEDALADLDAALDQAPELPASMYLRGIIRKRTGDAAEASGDLAAARMMSPRIDLRYGKWGIKP